MAMDFETFSVKALVDEALVAKHEPLFYSSTDGNTAFLGWSKGETFVVRYYICDDFKNLVCDIGATTESYHRYVMVHTSEGPFVELLERFGFVPYGKAMMLDTTVETVHIYHAGYREDFTRMGIWVNHLRSIFEKVRNIDEIAQSMERKDGKYVVVVGLVLGFVRHAFLLEFDGKVFKCIALYGTLSDGYDNTVAHIKRFEYNTLGDDIEFVDI